MGVGGLQMKKVRVRTTGYSKKKTRVVRLGNGKQDPEDQDLLCCEREVQLKRCASLDCWMCSQKSAAQHSTGGRAPPRANWMPCQEADAVLSGAQPLLGFFLAPSEHFMCLQRHRRKH